MKKMAAVAKSNFASKNVQKRIIRSKNMLNKETASICDATETTSAVQ